MRVIGTERGNECKVLLCPQDVKLDCEVMGSKFSSPQTSRVSDPVELVKSTAETHFLYKIQRGVPAGKNSSGEGPMGLMFKHKIVPTYTVLYVHTHTYTHIPV